MGLLDGQTALVTGGGKGIGRAVVDRFIAEGANLAVLVRAPEDAAGLERQHGQRVVCHVGDVRNWADNVAIVDKALAHFGRLDTLIPNAAVYDFSQPFEELTGPQIAQQFDELMHINVKGYLLAVRASLDALRAARGSIIFTLSSSSFHAGGGGVLYVTAKHGLVGAMRQLAYELAPEIRVNGVAPGGTRTSLGGLETGQTQNVELNRIDGLEQRIARALPLGFLSEPADHAGLYVTLAASQMSRFVTASIFRSDGGVDVRGGGRRSTKPAEKTGHEK